MWINEAAPECVAELFHNYQNALRVFGKGSESADWNESEQQGKDRITVAAERELKSKESRDYFAQPGEAEWGC